MSWFDRLGRVLRSNLTHWFQSNQDPAEKLEEIISEMQTDLIQMRQAVAQAIAAQKRTERQVSRHLISAQDCYHRAQYSLEQGEENLAREALSRRQNYLETSKYLQTQIEQQEQLTSKLKQDLRELEAKLNEIKLKKEMYTIRANSAEATLRLRELLAQNQLGSVGDIFERVEDKILALEAKAEAIADLAEQGIEAKFQNLEDSQAIEQELDQLKQQNPPP